MKKLLLVSALLLGCTAPVAQVPQDFERGEWHSGNSYITLWTGTRCIGDHLFAIAVVGGNIQMEQIKTNSNTSRYRRCD